MAKSKYRFNPESLSYDKVDKGLRYKVYKTLINFAALLLSSFILYFVYSSFIDTPEEKSLQRENEQLLLQYEIINKKFDLVEATLKDIEQRANDVQNENKRLKSELKEIASQLIEQKNMYSLKFAQQEKEMKSIKRDAQNRINDATANSEKKVTSVESRYLKQIEKLEKTNMQLKESYEKKLNNVTTKLRTQV